jgi:hypothetical protein
MKKLNTTNFGSPGILKNIRSTVYALVFGCLILIVQSCGPHYVAQVPAGGIDVRTESPYAGAVWVDGGWAWRGGHHAYTSGYWDHPRVGKTYHAGEWRHNDRGHYWVNGRWN